MKFALGSAAWRSRYGSFSKGPLSDSEIEILLAQAAVLGFDFIDTAPSYGDTEETLGRIKIHQSLTTKVTVDTSDISSISKSINLSRKNLKVDTLDLVFIHNWDVLSRSDKYKSVDAIQYCLSKETIKGWGFSTYEVSEFTNLQSNGWTDLTVQINSNILDQRILDVCTPHNSNDFKSRKIEIWVRSIFLQGVLLDRSPKNPYIAHPDIVSFFSHCANLNISPTEMCLAYIRQMDFVDCVIIGIENGVQLKEIASALQVNVPKIDFRLLESYDSELIDPRKWSVSK